jgi:hypothetical protein
MLSDRSSRIEDLMPIVRECLAILEHIGAPARSGRERSADPLNPLAHARGSE